MGLEPQELIWRSLGRPFFGPNVHCQNDANAVAMLTSNDP